MNDYMDRYLREAEQVLRALDRTALQEMLDSLQALRRRQGRLFILGVGGSASNASHAVNDFRKIAGIESYAPTDNVGELTARINDEGWESCFADWLRGSRLSPKDAVMVFSVGGGSQAVSVNLVQAVDYAKGVGAEVLGIVSRDGGHTARVADHHILIPPQSPDTITPLAEAFQPVVWHLLATALAKGADR